MITAGLSSGENIMLREGGKQHGADDFSTEKLPLKKARLIRLLSGECIAEHEMWVPFLTVYLPGKTANQSQRQDNQKGDLVIISSTLHTFFMIGSLGSDFTILSFWRMSGDYLLIRWFPFGRYGIQDILERFINQFDINSFYSSRVLYSSVGVSSVSCDPILYHFYFPKIMLHLIWYVLMFT